MLVLLLPSVKKAHAVLLADEDGGPITARSSVAPGCGAIKETLPETTGDAERQPLAGPRGRHGGGADNKETLLAVTVPPPPLPPISTYPVTV